MNLGSIDHRWRVPYTIIWIYISLWRDKLNLKLSDIWKFFRKLRAFLPPIYFFDKLSDLTTLSWNCNWLLPHVRSDSNWIRLVEKHFSIISRRRYFICLLLKNKTSISKSLSKVCFIKSFIQNTLLIHCSDFWKLLNNLGIKNIIWILLFKSITYDLIRTGMNTIISNKFIFLWIFR